MSKNRLDLDDLKVAAGNATSPLKKRKRSEGYMGHRETTLANLHTSKMKKILQVDPARCKLWSGHDRDYELLNEESCADLIDGIKSEGQQQFPAIVRPVANDKDYDWEVICGARRHWTVTYLRKNNYPNIEFLIEPRSLTDEAAFRLSDIENRDRADLCDYERAIKYWKALNEFQYYKSQKDMAERIAIDQHKLHRFISLAELPETIVYAYPSIKEIKVDHARLLAPLLNKKKIHQQILSEANSIREEQQTRLKAKMDLMPGAEVFKRLKIASTEKKAKVTKAKDESIESASGKIAVTIKQGRAGVLEMKWQTKNIADKAEFNRLAKQIADKFF